MHNYIVKLIAMRARGELSSMSGLSDVQIEHDDWCLVFNGGECNCDPTITVVGSNLPLEEMVERTVRNIRRFRKMQKAKRQ